MAEIYTGMLKKIYIIRRTPTRGWSWGDTEDRALREFIRTDNIDHAKGAEAVLSHIKKSDNTFNYEISSEYEPCEEIPLIESRENV